MPGGYQNMHAVVLIEIRANIIVAAQQIRLWLW